MAPERRGQASRGRKGSQRNAKVFAVRRSGGIAADTAELHRTGGGAAGGGEDAPPLRPLGRRGAHLRSQVSLRRHEGLLPLLPLSRRDLPQVLTHSIAELPHQGHPALVVKCQYPHTAGVVHHLPPSMPAVWQQHLVIAHPDDASVVNFMALQRFFRQILHDSSLHFFAV